MVRVRNGQASTTCSQYSSHKQASLRQSSTCMLLLEVDAHASQTHSSYIPSPPRPRYNHPHLNVIISSDVQVSRQQLHRLGRQLPCLLLPSRRS